MVAGKGVGQILGVTGLSIWSGVLGEEYLTALKGTRKAKVFREMQDDAVIACLLDAITMPLLAAEFEVVPAGDTPRDKENAEFLKSCMDDMTKYTWRQHVLDMLTMLVWGWSVSEVVFKKRLGPEGAKPSRYNDGRLGLHILDPRGQETLYRWKMDEEFSIEIMYQQDPNSFRIIEIPAWKLLHSTFRSRKRSPEGSSPLRSLYRAWYTRKNLEVIEAIGAERDLCGLPVISLPFGATDDDKAEAELLIRNIRLDEEAGLVIPAPPSPDAGDSGWKFELIGSPGTKQYDVRAIIKDLNTIILMRFFAQFLLLGMQQVGTQALVEGSQEFFSLCLKSVQQELLEMWNMQLVPFLFRMNPQLMAGASGHPTIDWAEPGSKDVQKAIVAATGLINSQLLTPEAQLEDYFRTMMGLPDRPAGVGEGPRTAAPSSPFGPQLMNYEWYQLPDGGWMVKPKQVSKMFAQPGPSDVHIPTAIGNEKKKKRRDQCMNCSAAPTVEVLWAEGMARAWFCDKCYEEWKEESEAHQVVEERKVDNGTVQERWSEQFHDVVELSNYAEVAGIKGRRATTKAGRATNEYQGLLTHIYDKWSRKAQEAILSASEGERKGLVKEVDKQLLSLAKELKAAAGKHIDEAVRLGMKGPLDKQGLKLVEQQVKANDKFVDESLIPRIREKIVSHLDDLEEQHQYQLDEIGLLGLLQSLRGEPSGYAGAFWNGIWLAAGIRSKREDKEREEEGRKPKRVRWVLDPAAEHCKDSEHGHGCPNLAGEYSSWDELPTVPAGEVTCLGNCRCHIEVETEAGWESVA